jgi:two-component system response regulator NreC
VTADGGPAAGGAQIDWEDRITIVVSDGQEMVRTGLCLLLAREPDLVIVADVSDGAAAASALTAFDPDVLVLDLGLRGPASLAAVPELREAHPRCAIVVLALQGDPELARETLGLGASAFVVKSAPGAELIGAIRLVAAGRTYLSPELGAQPAIDRNRRHGPDGPGGRELSRRELEVLKLIGRGHTNAEIANQLYLSVRTVESHRARIQQKLGRTGRAELVAHARGLGLI